MNAYFSKLMFILLIISSIILASAGFFLIDKSYDVYNTSVEMAKTKENPTDIVCKDCVKEGYSSALLYFTLSAGILLIIVFLPRLQSFTFGGVSVTLKDLVEDVNSLKSQNNELQEKLADSGGKASASKNIHEINNAIEENRKDILHPDDPQKGMWGGASKINGRELTAQVFPSIIPGLYKVTIRVATTGGASQLKGLVKFHLHNTFKNKNPVIAVKDGVAELILKYVYGAFTIGAEADNGKTKLELDLAELPNISEDFKAN